jgi:biopolymer transport protein ExbD
VHLKKKINMAQIELDQNRKSKKSFTKRILKVDLTPMVDLGFLLITFFILTTTLSEPTIARLIMPKNSKVNTPVKESSVLTLMLARNDSIDYYEGDLPKSGIISHCSFRDLRSLIQQKQNKVSKVLGDRKETVIVIYPGNQSTYKNFVDVLDEIEINDVSHYFVMNPNH